MRIGPEGVNVRGPEGLTPAQEQLCAALHKIGAVKIDAEKGFRLKLHEVNPEAPLSPIYVDLRALQRDPESKRIAVDVLEELLRPLSADVIAGIPLAATPLASSLSDRLGIGMVTPRLGKKTHGTGAQIDGLMPGDEGKVALLFDDLVTGADSKLEAAEVARQVFRVMDVVVLINRGGDRAVQQLAEHGLTLHAAFTLQQMLDYLRRTEKITQAEYDKVVDYLKDSQK